MILGDRIIEATGVINDGVFRDRKLFGNFSES